MGPTFGGWNFLVPQIIIMGPWNWTYKQSQGLPYCPSYLLGYNLVEDFDMLKSRINIIYESISSLQLAQNNVRRCWRIFNYLLYLCVHAQKTLKFYFAKVVKDIWIREMPVLIQGNAHLLPRRSLISTSSDSNVSLQSD